MKIKFHGSKFTTGEIALWFCSVLVIITSFLYFSSSNWLVLIASLIGVTSLIFNAKADPFGQVLMIAFSLIYGIISFQSAYYGEMITYLGMTAPMALAALITWIHNPFASGSSEVEVCRIDKRELMIMMLLAAGITFIFYFILKFFHTANLIPSTISVTTSFAAVYLTWRRNPYFALGYATNDIVLIILWILAARENIGYISVVVCFMVFLVNDLYGFFNWKRIEKRQAVLHKKAAISL